MKLGYIGLGKMGHNMVLRLLKKRYSVVAFDTDERARDRIRRAGARTTQSVRELIWMVPAPRLIWLMVPHDNVDEALGEILKYAKRGDTVIDGGNSFFEDTVRRAKKCAKRSIGFLDVGVSGGPKGALTGACLMIGGEIGEYKRFVPLWKDLAAEDGFAHVGASGAGHFVKMAHNGIEYGMMQALAEGFSVMKKSKFKFDLKKVAELYNRGSVIESRLVGWLRDAYAEYGEDLKEVSGTVGHTGEGEWTLVTAKKLGVPAKVIEDAFRFRVRSKRKPSYAGQILSALRNQFGGHRALRD